MPFMRAHASISTLSGREPWLRSPRVQQVIRNAIKQRYAQTHYLYTTFKHSTQTGTPILRPMWYEFPADTGNAGGGNFCRAPHDSLRRQAADTHVFCPQMRRCPAGRAARGCGESDGHDRCSWDSASAPWNDIRETGGKTTDPPPAEANPLRRAGDLRGYDAYGIGYLPGSGRPGQLWL